MKMLHACIARQRDGHMKRNCLSWWPHKVNDELKRRSLNKFIVGWKDSLKQTMVGSMQFHIYHVIGQQLLWRRLSNWWFEKLIILEIQSFQLALRTRECAEAAIIFWSQIVQFSILPGLDEFLLNFYLAFLYKWTRVENSHVNATTSR